MQDDDFKTILQGQRHFFESGVTLLVDYRIEQLKKLNSLIDSHENEIIEALKQDLNKPPTETMLNEIMLIKDEIHFAIKNVKKWSRPVKVSTKFPHLWPGKSL